MNSKNIITSLSWVAKGYARNTTKQHEPTPAEIKTIQQQGKQALKEVEEHDALLDKYDEEDNLPQFSGELGQHQEEDDEEMEEEENQEDYEDMEESEQEKEDFTIRKTDSLLAVGTTEHGQYSNIEVYIYDEETSSLYVHHEIMLSSLPISLTWLGLDPHNNQKANYAILGSFLEQIEIWNLDVSDAIEPSFKLIQAHSDGTLSLSLNPSAKHILASGGGDSQIKLWDITEQKCSATLNKLHSEKVHTVLWSGLSQSALLTGGYDGKLHVRDVKADVGITISTPGDIEDASFHPTSKYHFAAAFEDSGVEFYDIRKAKSPISRIKKLPVTALSFCKGYDGLLACGGKDGVVRILDTKEELKIIESKKMGVGELFCLKCDNDLDKTIATGGSEGQLAIWDLESSERVVQHFGGGRGSSS